MTAPIIFLDIDGVLRPGNAASKGRHHLPRDKIDLLNQAIAATGAVLVVSSTWRLDEECRDRLGRAGLQGVFHEDWRTPRWWDLKEAYGDAWSPEAPSRGSEIASWLGRHEDVVAWAILDDDNDMLPDQVDRFIKTEFRTGLCRGHVEVLIEVLQNPPPPRIAFR